MKKIFVGIISLLLVLTFVTGCKEAGEDTSKKGTNIIGSKTMTCEKSEIEDGMKTDTKVVIKYNSNKIKNIDTEVFMEVDASLIGYMLPVMQGMKETFSEIKGFTYDVKEESSGIKIIQSIDYSKFNEAEAKKLADKMGVPYEEYFDGETPSLEMYQQNELEGYTCK